MIAAEPAGPGIYRILDLVEKPPAGQAPSDLAIIGRYVLTPDIFPMLEETARERGAGEIQLTNGLKKLLKTRPLYGCEINGVRHDTGNKLGFLKAVVYFALRRPDLAGPFREYLEDAEPGLAWFRGSRVAAVGCPGRWLRRVLGVAGGLGFRRILLVGLGRRRLVGLVRCAVVSFGVLARALRRRFLAFAR